MQQRKAYRQVPDFNLIPPEYLPPVIFSRRYLLRLLLVLVIAAAVFFIQSALQETSAIESDTATVREQLLDIAAQFDAANAQRGEADRLTADVEALRSAGEALESEWAELTTEHADWPEIMAALFQRPGGVELNTITKVDATHVDVTGSASDYGALLQYRAALQRSRVISRIISLRSLRAESSVSFSLSVEVMEGK